MTPPHPNYTKSIALAIHTLRAVGGQEAIEGRESRCDERNIVSLRVS
jgi:hypothetical protein